MNVVTTNHAGTKLPYLINKVANSHQPILITNQQLNAVLISEEDCHSGNALFVINTRDARIH